MDVHGSLFATAFGARRLEAKAIHMVRATVAGDVNFTGAALSGPLDAENVKIAESLLMSGGDGAKTDVADFDIAGAAIGGDWDVGGAGVHGAVGARGTSVGGNLIAGNAIFDKPLDFDTLKVTGNVFARGAQFTQALKMVFAHVGRNFDLRGAKLSGLDLSGARIEGEFRLGGGPPVQWSSAKDADGLKLRTAHVGVLMDDATSWPPAGKLAIDAFTFDRLGGFEGESGSAMLGRGAQWWDSWARRDPAFSPAPYLQLAAAFTLLGDGDGAKDIQYFGRERAREATCADAWTRGTVGSCALQTALKWGTGYGIGVHSFRVVTWLSLFSAVGAFILWRHTPAADDPHKGALWCVGASLSRLLPGIELNREFSDFFNDPERKVLTFWQSAYFSTYVIVGWLLLGLLFVAISDLAGRG